MSKAMKIILPIALVVVLGLSVFLGLWFGTNVFGNKGNGGGATGGSGGAGGTGDSTPFQGGTATTEEMNAIFSKVYFQNCEGYDSETWSEGYEPFQNLFDEDLFNTPGWAKDLKFNPEKLGYEAGYSLKLNFADQISQKPGFEFETLKITRIRVMVKIIEIKYYCPSNGRDIERSVDLFVREYSHTTNNFIAGSISSERTDYSLLLDGTTFNFICTFNNNEFNSGDSLMLAFCVSGSNGLYTPATFQIDSISVDFA